MNRLIARLDDRDDVTFLDIGAKFLEPDGRISPDVMYDFLHPTAKGYAIWSAAMAPTLERAAGRGRVARCADGPAAQASGGSRFANRAISFFWPTLANRTISFMSASPPSTAMTVPTPNCGCRTRRPAL